jgi:heme A synthase
MQSPWPHRCAALLAALTFLSVLTGTAVTSNEERPFYSVGRSHVWLGAAIAILTIVLVIVMRSGEKRLWVRRLVWTALAAVAGQALLGLQPLPQPPAVRIAHAFVAQIFFPLTIVIALCTSAGWEKLSKPVETGAFLRLFTGCTPVLVLAQVVLGTLFRHGALGVGPHLIGAFVFASSILCLALPVIYRPEHHSLHLAARCFLAIASAQVFLGLALFSMQSMNLDPPVVILVTMIHAAIGALTLAATVTMAVLIRRSILASA